LLRCLNRMNDLVPGCRVEGDVRYRGIDLYEPEVDPVAVRTRIGLVFQRPNPFPKSIYDNVAFGPRTHGFHGDLDDIVERALRRAALWDEVKTRLGERALALSGGQQQRLVIARSGGRARHSADGRAGIRAGPDQHFAHRGPDARAHTGCHDRDRDA
jgi:phosphate transport system ATP-binding protein